MARIPELKSRIFYTLMLLAVYRIGIFITVPGVDREAVRRQFEDASGGLLGLFDMFSGGAMENYSIFALGIMPYISASIILQLLTVVVPALDRLNKEGEQGRRKINQYTRYGTVALCLVQGFGFSATLADPTAGSEGVMGAGFWFQALSVLTLTAGAVFMMWIGERITDRGIGNGISLLIFAGIAASLPTNVAQTWNLSEMSGKAPGTGTLSTPTLLIIAGMIVLVIGCVVFFERGQRRIPVRYAKKVVGTRMYGGQNTYLPLKVNTAGVIPPIFASSILLFPATLANLFPESGAIEWLRANLVPGQITYNVLYVGLIVFFCYFYTAVMFNPVDVADNLKKYGGFIPGIRAGKKTAEYIDRVLSRITLGGALYMATVCVLPTFLQSEFSVPFFFGGTALLIVVGVALDTVQQIEGYLIAHHYEGFGGEGGPRVRGRRRG
jgi:preprotein translocase subunit SecY